MNIYMICFKFRFKLAFNLYNLMAIKYALCSGYINKEDSNLGEEKSRNYFVVIKLIFSMFKGHH